MDVYEVLEKRRTIRDFSEKEVDDSVLKRILNAALKAPSNDHLHQLEFVVVRGRDRILPLIETVAENTKVIQQTGLEAGKAAMDADELDMFVDALPKQQRMLMQSGCLVLPFFRQIGCPLCQPADQSSLNYFASAWCAVENMLLAAAAEGLGAVFHIPVGDEAGKIKEIVRSPEGYELACLLTVGYPAEGAFLPRQKVIHAEERIHQGAW